MKTFIAGLLFALALIIGQPSGALDWYGTSATVVGGPVCSGTTRPGDLAPCNVAVGTKFTTTGCAVSATTGTAFGGTYTSGTTGSCPVVITINGATGYTAPTGFYCTATDTTTPADIQTFQSSTLTTATISGTTVSGDVVHFQCWPQ